MLRIFRPLARLTTSSTVNSRIIASRSLSTAAHAQKAPWHSTASKTMAWTTLGATLTAAAYLNLKAPAYAEAPVYVGTVEDPETQLVFPIFLNTNNEWKRLVGLGVRQVTFLNMNVYVLGLYMRSEDIGELKKLDGWKNFEKSEFLEKENLADAFLEQPYDLSIRLVPCRVTNTQHLRDGFIRLLMHRMKEQSFSEEKEREILGAIQEFKSNFVSMKVKKDTEFVFTKTKEGGLKMVYEGKDLGTVNNKWLAKNFIMGYLNPKAPSSMAALLDIADGFDRLMKQEVEGKEEK